MSDLTLDAGALIAFDCGSHRMIALVKAARERGVRLIVPTCALAQAWRDGATQARLARLLKSDLIVFEPLDPPRARAVGEICGRSGTSDIADASVVLAAARHGGFVATSDAGDLTRIDRRLVTIPVD